MKRTPEGAVDFRSPLPSWFNYGSVPGTLAADGDPEDAVVLGPRLAAGTEVEVWARAVVRFVDAGVPDPKLICSASPLRPVDRLRVDLFFRLYARGKRWLNRARGRSGRTAYEGLDPLPEDR